jgi:hypothetical protein
MPFGERVFNPAGDRAEGDKLFGQYVYADAGAAVTIGIPLFVAPLDAAEFNTKIASTAITTAGEVRTGGQVVRSTNANVGAAPQCVGLNAPENPGESLALGTNSLPANVRVLMWGRGIVSAQSPAAGSAGLVGGTGILSTTVVQVVPGTAAVGTTIGIFLSSTSVTTIGGSLFAAASATVGLYNFFVRLV